VGRELMVSLRCSGSSTTLKEGFLRVDATKPLELQACLRGERPRVVINCVGLADVDRSEREPALADALNHVVVENLVEAQQATPFDLVHISTDYVFDGSRGGYRETDATHPVNEYGRSKLEGERAALRSESSLVLRIAAPYGQGFGARRTQFFRYLADSLRVGKPATALTDQRLTATYLPDLARAIPTLLKRDVHGVIHIGSDESLTRFEFAQKVARAVGAAPALVIPGLRKEMTQWTAPRPADTSLDVGVSRALGVSYTPTSTALAEILSI
jgi:dTDP-4-dehydrorhamnose reductase